MSVVVCGREDGKSNSIMLLGVHVRELNCLFGGNHEKRSVLRSALAYSGSGSSPSRWMVPTPECWITNPKLK